MRFVTDHSHVRVPATSANLGPGFDAFGIALPIWDDVHVEAIAGPTRVEVTGHGQGNLPTGDDHLILRALRVALDFVDAPQAGFLLRCHNEIPHGRGMGSSAAATVAGLMLARGLISDQNALNDEVLLTLATEFEGHPDNAAPALLGGATIAYMRDGQSHAAKIPVNTVPVTILIPEFELATSHSRGALPPKVPHADAAFNSARTGLLALALSGQPQLLWEATEDRLHQEYRASVMPQTHELLRQLREHGHAATVSGAGPSLLVLGDFSGTAPEIVGEGWRIVHTHISPEGAHLMADLR